MLIRTAGALAAAVACVVVAATGSAATGGGTSVAFSVETVFGGPEMVTTGLPFCSDGAAVQTLEDTVRFPPPAQAVNAPVWFSGAKELSCGSSGVFTVRFSVKWFPCSGANEGHWRVVGGSGIYAGLKGHGRLVGAYPGGDGCVASGVVDTYSGVMKLG